MHGGQGICPTKVGDLTLDQAYMMLVEMDNLRAGSHAVRSMSSLEVLNHTTNGEIKGRTGDGKPLVGKIAGKSLCARLTEEAEAKARAEALQKQKEKSIPKRRRGNK